MNTDFITTLIVTIIVFTAIVLASTSMILLIRSWLGLDGKTIITINDKKKIEAHKNFSLLNILSHNQIFIPSTCAGKGTCGMCKCKIMNNNEKVLPLEKALLSKKELKNGIRLACQVKVKKEISIEIDKRLLDVKRYKGTVLSNNNISPLIKELILEINDLCPGLNNPGNFIQLEIPTYQNIKFDNFDILEKFKSNWTENKLLLYESTNDEETIRAYSIADINNDNTRLSLNIKLAIPPKDLDVSPGLASSYLFNLKKEDSIFIQAPFHELKKPQINNDICFIAGGVGIVPIRTLIQSITLSPDNFHKIILFYGARDINELIYHTEFCDIAEEYKNFKYVPVLSHNNSNDWTGLQGMLYDIFYKNFLEKHLNAKELQYYISGPSIVTDNIQILLQNEGVDSYNINIDNFGSLQKSVDSMKLF